MVGERELRVSTLELFFDLVYVFAITQIATLLSGDLNPAGFGRAVLLLGLVWWAWSQYAWALNAVGNEGTAVRAALVAAMAGSLLLAQAVPDSFADAGVWFAVGYVVVRYLGLGRGGCSSRGWRPSSVWRWFALWAGRSRP